MRKVLISLIILMLVISMSISVNAATTGTITLTLSKTNINPGEEFSVIVSASDLNYLNALEYSLITVTDENGNDISELISEKEVVSASEDWGPYVDMDNPSIKYYLYKNEEIKKQSGQVFKVTFETSQTIEPGTYNINIQGLKVYNTNLKDDTTNIGTRTESVNVVVDPEIVFNTLPVRENKYVFVSAGMTSANITLDVNQEKLYGVKPGYTNLTTDGRVKTGSKISLKGEEKYTVVVLGDVNCDGIVTFKGDIIRANSIRLSPELEVNPEVKFATDIDESGTIEFMDIIKINGIRLAQI